MHKFTLPQAAIDRSITNRGVAHPFGVLDPAKTALLVIDMQNYYLKPGYLGDVPMACGIVPAINKFAADLRGACDLGQERIQRHARELACVPSMADEPGIL